MGEGDVERRIAEEREAELDRREAALSDREKALAQRMDAAHEILMAADERDAISESRDIGGDTREQPLIGHASWPRATGTGTTCRCVAVLPSTGSTRRATAQHPMTTGSLSLKTPKNWKSPKKTVAQPVPERGTRNRACVAQRSREPAVDLVVAWEVLDPAARELFRSQTGVDGATWLRGRAWVLSITMMIWYYWMTMPARRASCVAVVRNVLVDAGFRM